MKDIRHDILGKVQEVHVTPTGEVEGWVARAAESSRTRRGVPAKDGGGYHTQRESGAQHSELERAWVTFRGGQKLSVTTALG